MTNICDHPITFTGVRVARSEFLVIDRPPYSWSPDVMRQGWSFESPPMPLRIVPPGGNVTFGLAYQHAPAENDPGADETSPGPEFLFADGTSLGGSRPTLSTPSD